MDEENVYLVLGCHGRVEDGFVLCSSLENRILKLDDSLVSFSEVVDYLEAVRLFERPMIDYNAIRNLVYKLQDTFDQKVKRLWSERDYNIIERFIVMHRSCGLYSRLVCVQKSADKVSEPEPHSFVIRASNTSSIDEEIPKTKIARGRIIKH